MLKYSQSNIAKKDVKRIIFLIHGYGSNDADLLSIAPEIEKFMPNTLVVTPQAPYPHESGIPGVYQWYSLMVRDDKVFYDAAQKIKPMIEELIDSKLDEYGLSYDDLVIGGFSQGGMITQHIGFRLKKSPKGLMSFSGYIAAPEKLAEDITVKPPILILHGMLDSIVPVAALDRSVQTLNSLGVDVQSKKLAGLDHGINFEAIELAGKFLQNIW